MKMDWNVPVPSSFVFCLISSLTIPGEIIKISVYILNRTHFIGKCLYFLCSVKSCYCKFLAYLKDVE